MVKSSLVKQVLATNIYLHNLKIIQKRSLKFQFRTIVFSLRAQRPLNSFSWCTGEDSGYICTISNLYSLVFPLNKLESHLHLGIRCAFWWNWPNGSKKKGLCKVIKVFPLYPYYLPLVKRTRPFVDVFAKHFVASLVKNSLRWKMKWWQVYKEDYKNYTFNRDFFSRSL